MVKTYGDSPDMNFMKSLHNPRPTNAIKSIRSFQPAVLLASFVHTYGSGCLEVDAKSLSWWIYFKDGKLNYASLASEKTLIYALKWLKLKIATMSHDAFSWLDQNSEELLDINSQNIQSIQYFEYQIICYLVDQKLLASWQAEELIEELTQDAIESFLSLTGGAVRIDRENFEIPVFCKLDPKTTLENCQARLKSWKRLSPLLSSPHQRPYIVSQDTFFNTNNTGTISPRLKNKLGTLLRGYSIRHIAAILHQDELEFAKFLYPYIDNKSIILRTPESPWDRLAGLENESLTKTQAETPIREIAKEVSTSIPQVSAFNKKQKTRPVIACVDDSPNTLDQIERFLGQENYSIFKFLEPIKATFQLKRLKPDMILLDLTMPTISGYELCRMLRRLPGFEEIPVVMVTGKKGIINKTRAKLVGATDYLEKPFNRASLLDVISRNLP
ncbi:response regulator [Leptothoe sp. PORK10 BA2]|uniref:response regulator n=1 Tax=Leptothoe sp. PORK10 BA2 TaxID=3110254 RepID=UPI002B20A2DF|nr:response regulator [Leptothoe sp. PORK10 BA2]MEA5464349.1 response regulator [Leptothoe sp. PORK10 BA2]